MSYGEPVKYLSPHLDFKSFGTSVTNISMDSNESSLMSMTPNSKGISSYDDYEQNRSSFSSDGTHRESIISNNLKENNNSGHDTRVLSPRSSFNTVEDQYDYFRHDKNDSGMDNITRDMDKMKFSNPNQQYSSKLNLLLFPEMNPQQEGNHSNFNREGNSKNSDKSIINILKAASEDAYEPSIHFLSTRKAASEDAYDDLTYSNNQNYTSKLGNGNMGINGSNGNNNNNNNNNNNMSNVNNTNSLAPRPTMPSQRRESFPITRSIQSGHHIGIAQVPQQLSPQSEQHYEKQINPTSSANLNMNVNWQNNNSSPSSSTSQQQSQHQQASQLQLQLQQVSQQVSQQSSDHMSSPQSSLSMHSNNSLMSTHSIPSRPSISTGSTLVYQVQFKRRIRHFITSTNSNLDIQIGDYVKVEADRGEDLGVVHGIVSVPTFLDLRRQHHLYNGGAKDEEGAWDLKQILRLASTYEKRQLPIKAQDELQVTQNAFDLATNVYGLPMTIVDSEFQFDRHKLVIYYDSSKRIDFREFVRDLFALYKTRIWMQQVNSSDSIPTSQTSPLSQQSYSSQGLAPRGRVNPVVAVNQRPSTRPITVQYTSQPQYLNQHSGTRVPTPQYTVDPVYLSQPGYVVDPTISLQYDEHSVYDPQSAYSQGYVYSSPMTYVQSPVVVDPSTSYQMYGNSSTSSYYDGTSAIQSSSSLSLSSSSSSPSLLSRPNIMN